MCNQPCVKTSSPPSPSSPPRSRRPKVGNGFEDGVNQGPLIEDAGTGRRCSAMWTMRWPRWQRWTGGKASPAVGSVSSSPPWWPRPPPTCYCAREENLRPVRAGVQVQDRAGKLDAANHTEFGLASYFCQRHRAHLPRGRGAGVRHGGHQCGHSGHRARCPLVVWKQSGLGREGSHLAWMTMWGHCTCIGDIQGKAPALPRFLPSPSPSQELGFCALLSARPLRPNTFTDKHQQYIHRQYLLICL